jgi:hypothetical protein
MIIIIRWCMGATELEVMTQWWSRAVIISELIDYCIIEVRGSKYGI